LEKKGDLKTASAKMTEAIALAPQEPSSYFNRARFRARMGQLAEAERDLDKYLESNASDADGFQLRGHVRLLRNDVSGALEDAKQALRLANNHDGARFVQAQAQRALGKYGDALKDYERLRRTLPDNDDVLAGLADCELNTGNNSSARLSFKKLAEKYPDNGWAHLMLGRALFGLQEFEKAIPSFRRAAELKIDPANTMRWIGYCRFALGEDQEAIAMLKEAVAAKSAMNPYPYLVLHVAIRRAELSVNDSPLEGVLDAWESEWARALGSYLLGRLSDKELVKLAKATKDQSQRDEQLCEAYYYIGATRIVEMDTVAAEVFFERVLGTRKSTFIEYTFARSELRARQG
jgi:tetratricopeptide (TPR) repeat protein